MSLAEIAVALFWSVSAVVGLTLTLRNFLTSYRGWRVLKRMRSVDQGMLIMAFSHVRTHAIFLWMHLTFVIVGAIASRPHDRYSLESWISTGVVMTVPLFLIVISATSAADREKAADSYTRRLDQ